MWAFHMRRRVLQSIGGAFVVILYVLSVAMIIAYHRSRYLTNIDASLSGLCFLADMGLIAVLVFQWSKSKLYHLWLALAVAGFAFAFAYCSVEESFFRPYPNLIESGERRIAYGCIGVVVFMSIYGCYLWKYKDRRFDAAEIVKSRKIQFLWALLAGILSFLGMATINDSIHPLNNYDIRWLFLALLFMILFVIPWVRLWILVKAKTPIIFDAGIVFLIGWFAGELATLSRSHFRPFSCSLNDFGNWEIIYLPFILTVYLVLRWAAQKGFYFITAVVLGNALTALLYVMQAGIIE